MKKIYSFLTAVLATFAINANAETLTTKAYYGDDYAEVTAADEEATIDSENKIITLTNFLGSGTKITIDYSNPDSTDEDAVSITKVEKGTGVYTFGTHTFTDIVTSQDNEEKELWACLVSNSIWIESYGTEAGVDGDVYFGLYVYLPSDNNIDPRYQSVQFYVKSYTYVNALLYGDKLKVDLGQDVLDFTITTDGSGSKSVVYNGEQGYKYDASGNYYYFFTRTDYYSYTDSYICAYIYDGANYKWIYIYLPTDEWANVTEYDAISYTYGYTSNSFSTGTNDPWYTATTTLKTKWNLDKGRLLIPDYLGSKQDLLVVFDDSSIKSVWSLSDVWYSEYLGWYDDSDEDPVTFYPWFDTVNKSNSYYIYPNYSTQSLEVYNNIALSTYTYYTSDSKLESQYEYTYIVKPAEVTGVNSITVDETSDAPVEYYNLQGVRVANPQGGLFIKRQGNKASKVIIK